MSTKAFHGARNFTVGRYEENHIGDFVSAVTNVHTPPNRRTTSQHQGHGFRTSGIEHDSGHRRIPPHPLQGSGSGRGPSQFHHNSLPSEYGHNDHEAYDEEIYTDQCRPYGRPSHRSDWDERNFLGQDFYDAMETFNSPGWPFPPDAHRSSSVPVFQHHERTFNYFGAPPRVPPFQPPGRDPSFAPPPPFYSQEPGTRPGHRHAHRPQPTPSFPQPTHGRRSMQASVPPPSLSSRWVGGFQPLSEEPNDMDALADQFSGVGVSNGGQATAPSNSRASSSGSSSGSSMSAEAPFGGVETESRLRRMSSQESIPPLIDFSDD